MRRACRYGGAVNRRSALVEAHSQAAALIRQYAEQQGGKLGYDDEDSADDDKVRAALHELADRHDRAARRSTTTGS